MTGDRNRRLLAEAQILTRFGVWEWSVATNELYWSDELYELFGFEREVAPSFEALLDRVHPDDRTLVKAYFSRALKTSERFSIEYRITLPTGEQRTLEGWLRGALDVDGAIRVIGTDHDITKTKDLAARLAFTDRMISVGTLAGGVAHEINNPLATIAANLEMLAETTQDASLADAREAVERIRRIVRGLMAFSRPDEDRRHPVDVERVLELAISMTTNEIRHKAKLVKRYGGPPPVHANEARLGHVFINLLVNSAESIVEGAANRNEIRVCTRTDAAGWIIVEIADTGAGIARDIQSRIFDPFFTTKPVGQGTGLGLSVCHGIVRSLGGVITVDSEPGVGSTFTVTLPPADTSAPERAVKPTSANHRGGARTILIVDDETMFARSIRRLLVHDFTVTMVDNGLDALDKLRAGERFDVILCDLMMPGMTGAEVYAEIETLAPDQALRMIFLTGGAFTPASQNFLARTTRIWFEKPCDLQALRSAIDDLIRGSDR